VIQCNPDTERHGPRFSISCAISPMNGHGGKRPGAGRPKGAASRANEQVRQEAAAIAVAGLLASIEAVGPAGHPGGLSVYSAGTFDTWSLASMNRSSSALLTVSTSSFARISLQARCQWSRRLPFLVHGSHVREVCQRGKYPLRPKGDAGRGRSA
jgi:hypothetical protein